MSPIELFKNVTEKGSYTIGYIIDGWTKTFTVQAKSATEAMMVAQNVIGSICNVTFVERS